MNVCSSQEFEVPDKKLNQVYHQLQAKISSRQKQRLVRIPG
ncbi:MULTISPECIES: lysozyme inhibitor LprI family protein [unclassified Microcoleus]